MWRAYWIGPIKLSLVLLSWFFFFTFLWPAHFALLWAQSRNKRAFFRLSNKIPINFPSFRFWGFRLVGWLVLFWFCQTHQNVIHIVYWIWRILLLIKDTLTPLDHQSLLWCNTSLWIGRGLKVTSVYRALDLMLLCASGNPIEFLHVDRPRDLYWGTS